MFSFRYALVRCTSTVRVVTNRAWAIWRFVAPSAARLATRSSLAVNASRPVVAVRRGRRPMSRNSRCAVATRGRASNRAASSSPSVRGVRAARLLADAAQFGAVLDEDVGALEHVRRGREEVGGLGEVVQAASRWSPLARPCAARARSARAPRTRGPARGSPAPGRPPASICPSAAWAATAPRPPFERSRDWCTRATSAACPQSRKSCSASAGLCSARRSAPRAIGTKCSINASPGSSPVQPEGVQDVGGVGDRAAFDESVDEHSGGERRVQCPRFAGDVDQARHARPPRLRRVDRRATQYVTGPPPGSRTPIGCRARVRCRCRGRAGRAPPPMLPGDRQRGRGHDHQSPAVVSGDRRRRRARRASRATSAAGRSPVAAPPRARMASTVRSRSPSPSLRAAIRSSRAAHYRRGFHREQARRRRARPAAEAGGRGRPTSTNRRARSHRLDGFAAAAGAVQDHRRVRAPARICARRSSPRSIAVRNSVAASVRRPAMPSAARELGVDGGDARRRAAARRARASTT